MTKGTLHPDIAAREAERGRTAEQVASDDGPATGTTLTTTKATKRTSSNPNANATKGRTKEEVRDPKTIDDSDRPAAGDVKEEGGEG